MDRRRWSLKEGKDCKKGEVEEKRREKWREEENMECEGLEERG